MTEQAGPNGVAVRIIRTRRKTIAMTLKPEGVEVRAPLWMPEGEIQQFISSHWDWIQKAVARQEKRQQALAELPRLTEEELRALAEKAQVYIPERVRFYAPQVGVSCGRITIKLLRSRWGSCSAKGNLNFNCLLMLAPPQVIDSVVVHELCHRKEMNHSDRFYREVLRVFPEYRECHKWLKEHGDAILSRVPEK